MAHIIGCTCNSQSLDQCRACTAPEPEDDDDDLIIDQAWLDEQEEKAWKVQVLMMRVEQKIREERNVKRRP